VQENGRLSEIALSHNSYHRTRDRCRQTPRHRVQLHVMFITILAGEGGAVPSQRSKGAAVEPFGSVLLMN
jgi:hypothetical protein